MLTNAIRGHCAEFGLIAPICGSRDLVDRMRQADSAALPKMVKQALALLID